jgi:hypothetical protein
LQKKFKKALQIALNELKKSNLLEPMIVEERDKLINEVKNEMESEINDSG